MHGDHRKMLDNHAHKCVLFCYSIETSTQYRVMDLNSSRVFIARDVKFDESHLYHQLLTTKPTRFALEQAKHDKDSEIGDEAHNQPKFTVQAPKAMIQSPKAEVQRPKASALPRAIIPIDDSHDDPTPCPETPPPETPPEETPPRKSRLSGRTAANVSIAMIIEQGPKTYRAALNAEDTEQWKEAIGKEVASMETHEVFTFFEKVPKGASMIGSHWVMGRKLMANGTIEKWKG